MLSSPLLPPSMPPASAEGGGKKRETGPVKQMHPNVGGRLSRHFLFFAFIIVCRVPDALFLFFWVCREVASHKLYIESDCKVDDTDGEAGAEPQRKHVGHKQVVRRLASDSSGARHGASGGVDTPKRTVRDAEPNKLRATVVSDSVFYHAVYIM